MHDARSSLSGSARMLVLLLALVIYNLFEFVIVTCVMREIVKTEVMIEI
jgi:hypothetical protein